MKRAVARRAHVVRVFPGVWHVCQTQNGILIPKGCNNRTTHREALDVAPAAVGLSRGQS